MPFCEKCGKQVPEDAQFCRACGAPQAVAVAPSAAQKGGEISGSELEEEHEKPKYDIYELGRSLERMTDEIHRHMNNKTETRQKLEDEKRHT